ncbi:MAG: T9SS type A sorting domain-containing protein [Bacteroidales bacterium]|nr:T9SS type A sorting domain-containing protein [Bacteroidales bacterium]
MKRLLLFILSVFVLFTYAQSPYNQNIDEKCSHQHQFANSFKNQTDVSFVADKYDMNFIHLNLLVSSSDTYVEGFALINSKVLSSTLDTFYLELNQTLSLDSMRFNGELVTPSFVNSEIFIVVDEMLEGDDISVITYYHGSSSSGGFFSGITSDYNYTYGKNVTWTLSEPFSARDWFPVRQSLEDKIDSVFQDYTCIDSDMVGSNGLLTEVTDNGNGTKTYSWRSHYPISYYLMSFAVSDFMDYSIYAKPLEMNGDSVLIQNFIYNEEACLNANQANIDMSTTILEVLSEKYGLYPFHEEKYGNCLAEIGGGMEHQTMTTIGSFSFGLNTHEMAHQWYGDNITCATWSDIWINEGFASYSEYVGAQYIQGQSAANSWMNSAHNTTMSQTGGSTYVPPSEIFYGNEWRIFDGRLTYKKGAAIIHQIRYLVNDDELFFEAMQNYTYEFTDSIATGLDFKTSMEASTGLDLDSYFDQWYFGQGYPTYSVEYSYNDIGLYMTITHTTSHALTPYFDLPLEIELNFGAGNDTIIRVPITSNTTAFQTGISDPIILLAIDPNNWIINRIGSIILGTSELRNNLGFVVGPNPVSQNLQLVFDESSNDLKTISIIDLSGRVIRSFTTNASTTIDVSDLNSGYYLVRATDGQETVTRRILKQ